MPTFNLGGTFSQFLNPPLLGRPEGRPVGATTGTGVQQVGFQNPVLQGLTRAGLGTPTPLANPPATAFPQTQMPITNTFAPNRFALPDQRPFLGPPAQRQAQANPNLLYAQNIMQKYGLPEGRIGGRYAY